MMKSIQTLLSATRFLWVPLILGSLILAGCTDENSIVDPLNQPPAGVNDWIQRIERSRSAVERRNTLSRALDVARDAGERAQLLEAASRIELAPIIGRVDGLSSAGAKKHGLQKAIDRIRADNIPEELAAEQIRRLEARLRDPD